MNTEIFGYIAIIFNIFGFINQSKKYSLLLGIIAILLYAINLIIIKAPMVGITITLLGLIINILSLYFINNENIRKFLIKLSILPAIIIINILGLNFVGLLTAFGFLFATIAKLQSNIINMKIWFLLSATTWLLFDFQINCLSCKIFDSIGILSLLITIYLIRKKDVYSI